MIDKCPVYSEAMLKMMAKYKKGSEEHGGVMSSAKIPVIEWMKMAQEEAIDQVYYLEKIIQDLEK
jgi:hypothetical protein